MLRVAICDDSMTDRTVLERLVKQYAVNVGVDISIEGYHGAELLIEAHKKENYDLVFMDIFLGGMQGNEAARVLLKDENCSVVFTTSSVEFALEGFEIGVLHYIVKPYSYDKVVKSMEKYMRNNHIDNMAVINIKPVGNDPETELKQNDICYIESLDKIRSIHLSNGELRTYTTLNDICKSLLENSFYRPHRSYVVNFAYVSKITKTDITLKNGEMLPVSRGTYEDLMNKYTKYMSR